MVRARVFVGNVVAECKPDDLKGAFSAFGAINRCDIKGTYAFIEFADEEDANVAIKEMDKTTFMGRELNVELGGKARRADRSKKVNGIDPGTVKLHISGIKMGGNADELAALFEPFGNVVDKYIMTDKDVGFVHIDGTVVEHAITAMDGKPFNGGRMKIEYGQVGKKPRYDRHAPKLTLHVGGISEEADENLIRMKFGIFGSIGDVKFLRNKNIAFVEIQEEYADNAIHHMHGSLFYGKEIKVAYSKHNRAQERSQDRNSGPRYEDRRSEPILPHYRPDDRSRFVYDDVSQLSNICPLVPKVQAHDIEYLIQRRRRLEHMIR